MPLSLPPRRPAAPAWNPRARDEPSLPLIAEHRHPINNRAVRPGSLAIQGGMKVTDGAAAASRRGRGRRHPGARGPRRTFSRSWGGAPGGKARTGVAPRSLAQESGGGAARPQNNIFFARAGPGAAAPRGSRAPPLPFPVLGGAGRGETRALNSPHGPRNPGAAPRGAAQKQYYFCCRSARAGPGAAAPRGSRASPLHFPVLGGAGRW